jgi:hypothetical protein
MIHCSYIALVSVCHDSQMGVHISERGRINLDVDPEKALGWSFELGLDLAYG